MRYARIEDGLVVAVEEWMPEDAPEELIQDDDVQLGDRWDGEAFTSSQPAHVWSGAATLSQVRELREMVLNRLAGIGFAALAANDTDTVERVLAARTALLGITTAPQVQGACDEASLRMALVTVYLGIKATAGPALDKAFQDFRL